MTTLNLLIYGTNKRIDKQSMAFISALYAVSRETIKNYGKFHFICTLTEITIPQEKNATVKVQTMPDKQ